MILPTYFPHDLRVHLPIELPRLVLRLPVARDTTAMLAAIEESRPELEEWMPWAASTTDVGALKRYVRRLPAGLRGGRNMDFGVFCRETGSYLGGMGFARIDVDAGTGEIGYWVRRSARARGVVTRVVAHLAELGFDTLSFGRIEIRCDSRNVTSARIPQKLGFTLDGCLRSGLPDHNDLTRRRDVHVFSLLPAEHRAKKTLWRARFVDAFDHNREPLVTPL